MLLLLCVVCVGMHSTVYTYVVGVVCCYVYIVCCVGIHAMIYRVESVFFYLLSSGDKTQVFRLLGGKYFIQGANSFRASLSMHLRGF